MSKYCKECGKEMLKEHQKYDICYSCKMGTVTKESNNNWKQISKVNNEKREAKEETKGITIDLKNPVQAMITGILIGVFIGVFVL